MPEQNAASILLVEDEPVVRRLMANVLRSANYRLAEAATAEDAFRLAAQLDTRPDLLVTDVVLPGVRGPELVEKLRRQHPDLAVLYVSGYVCERPTRGYLEKPFSPMALLDAVAEQLGPRSCGVGAHSNGRRPETTSFR